MIFLLWKYTYEYETYLQCWSNQDNYYKLGHESLYFSQLNKLLQV